MLVKFSVSNYKNFKEPITLNFTDVRDYKFNQYCINDGTLSKLIIFGNNGSGKSNFSYALFDIVGLLTDKTSDVKQLDPLSFLNADSGDKYATFEYVFKKDSHKITYIYEKMLPTQISSEKLYIDDVVVYSYDFEKKKFISKRLELIDAENLNFDYYENNLPILRYIANNSNQQDNSIVKFIMNFVSHMLWFRCLQDNGYIGYTTGAENIYSWIIENNYVEEFQEFLREYAGLDILLGVASVENQVPNRVLIEKHRNRPLIFESVASTGALSLGLFFYWSKRFQDVSLLFMDEFDAFYHFELSRNIIRFISQNIKAQAIFTTHNTYLASNDLLRPDCYYVLKNGQLESFADSTQREIREGHNLEKMLRNGEFDD